LSFGQTKHARGGASKRLVNEDLESENSSNDKADTHTQDTRVCVHKTHSCVHVNTRHTCVHETRVCTRHTLTHGQCMHVERGIKECIGTVQLDEKKWLKRRTIYVGGMTLLPRANTVSGSNEGRPSYDPPAYALGTYQSNEAW
jgi:hypothetical protein